MMIQEESGLARTSTGVEMFAALRGAVDGELDINPHQTGVSESLIRRVGGGPNGPP